MRLKEKDEMVMTGVWREKRVFFILKWRAVIPPS